MPAPYESCVACVRGDTTTGFALVGEPEWIIAALSKFTDMSIDEAQATLLVHCERDLGLDPGNVPAGEMTTVFRLCEACADAGGVPVGDVSTNEIPGYRQEADQ